MEGQTLKGKTVEVIIAGKSEFGHLDKDIVLAVEWLKGQVDVLITMNVKTWQHDGMTIYGHRLHEFKTMIDDAFEGVQG